MFAIIFSVTFEIHFTTQVAVALLFPVTVSVLVVLMFAAFTNVYHEVSKLPNVHVSIIVHPLPAGSVQIVKVLTGIFIHAGTRSVITTLFAGFPQLFP